MVSRQYILHLEEMILAEEQILGDLERQKDRAPLVAGENFTFDTLMSQSEERIRSYCRAIERASRFSRSFSSSAEIGHA